MKTYITPAISLTVFEKDMICSSAETDFIEVYDGIIELPEHKL